MDRQLAAVLAETAKKEEAKMAEYWE